MNSTLSPSSVKSEETDTTPNTLAHLKGFYDKSSSPDPYFLCLSSPEYSPSIPFRATAPVSSSEPSQSPVQSPLSPVQYSNQGTEDSSNEKSPMGSPRVESPASNDANASPPPRLLVGSPSPTPFSDDALSTASRQLPLLRTSPLPSASSAPLDFSSWGWSRSPSPRADLAMGAVSSHLKRPFYSLSPKVERDSPSPNPPSPSPATPGLAEADPTTANSPRGEANPRKGAGGGSPPCVVDLTCEEEDEDDDVEIVSADQPVVFLGSEANPTTTATTNTTTRRHKRRRRHDLLPRSSSSSSSSPTEELIVIRDSTPDPASALIELSDSPDTSLRGSSSSFVPGDPAPPIPPHHAGPQLFGDLLPGHVISVERENPSQSGGGSTARSSYLDFCGPGSRFGARGSLHQDRSHSPPRAAPFLVPSLLRSVIEAPIPPDVFEDIVSLEAERGPNSISTRRIAELSAASRIPPAATFSFTFSPTIPTPQSAPVPPLAPLPSAHPRRPPSADGSEDPACPICLESFKDLKRASRPVSSTVCGHVFCTECLEAYLKQAKVCPTCRRRLTKKQYHRIFI